MLRPGARICAHAQHFHYQKLAAVVDQSKPKSTKIIDLSVPHRAMTECYLHAVPHRKSR